MFICKASDMSRSIWREWPLDLLHQLDTQSACSLEDASPFFKRSNTVTRNHNVLLQVKILLYISLSLTVYYIGKISNIRLLKLGFFYFKQIP